MAENLQVFAFLTIFGLFSGQHHQYPPSKSIHAKSATVKAMNFVQDHIYKQIQKVHGNCEIWPTFCEKKVFTKRGTFLDKNFCSLISAVF